ncbi:MAG TPA: hypothetical protein GXX29_10910 [Firmicutes bacterium]|nr:hypothetical protein [Bacillota bacterium]
MQKNRHPARFWISLFWALIVLLGFPGLSLAGAQALSLTPAPVPVAADYGWKACDNNDDPACAPGTATPTPPTYDKEDQDGKKPVPVTPTPQPVKPVKPDSSSKSNLKKADSGGGFFSRLAAEIISEMVARALYASYHKNSSLALNAGALSRRSGLDLELESRFGILLRLLAAEERIGFYTGWRLYLSPERHNGPYLGWYFGAHSRAKPYPHSSYQIGGTCGYRQLFFNIFFFDFNITHLTETAGLRSETQIRPLVGIKW